MDILDTINKTIETILGREAADGGFSARGEGVAQPDATAWAVLALSAAGVDKKRIGLAQERLVDFQGPDGRVVFAPRLSSVSWATPLAVLAWLISSDFEGPRQKATDFLLTQSGLHWTNENPEIVGHDTSLRGWPWVSGTHSWIEPTSLSMLALRAAGFNEHERMAEAVAMILDRQLDSGGWNYGNTTIFGTQLQPIPESTGLALSALEGHVPKERVDRSIDYVKKQVAHIRTPLTLSWAILGLGAWSDRPQQAREWIEESLHLQSQYGEYNTSLLSILILAYHASGGFLSAVRLEG
ncbi:prenyltransferase/squalene oxidase repeat-containing protein [Acidobacteriota bacterium]